jgi:hypothetical protein
MNEEMESIWRDDWEEETWALLHMFTFGRSNVVTLMQLSDASSFYFEPFQEYVHVQCPLCPLSFLSSPLLDFNLRQYTVLMLTPSSRSHVPPRPVRKHPSSSHLNPPPNLGLLRPRSLSFSLLVSPLHPLSLPPSLISFSPAFLSSQQLTIPFSFPGCTGPNSRQSIQAPGLLDCSALGAEVQHCQSLGKRVLLSVKASGLGAVAGNAAFGDPNAPAEPLGKAFAAVEGGRVKLQKRQVDAPVGLAGPVFNITGSKLPMGHGPVVVDGSIGGSPVVVAEVNPLAGNATASPTALPTGFPNFPNLFDESHPPSAFALTLFSLFGEGHTERADLRPLGPDVPSGASPPVLNGTNWVNPILTALQRPLGEEVVVDGFDIQIPAEWKGTYQDFRFQDLVTRLRQLHDEAWTESGGVIGGPADLGADGKGVVYSGWIGGALKVRSAGLTVVADTKRKGWVEWNPMSSA